MALQKYFMGGPVGSGRRKKTIDYQEKREDHMMNQLTEAIKSGQNNDGTTININIYAPFADSEAIDRLQKIIEIAYNQFNNE